MVTVNHVTKVNVGSKVACVIVCGPGCHKIT